MDEQDNIPTGPQSTIRQSSDDIPLEIMSSISDDGKTINNIDETTKDEHDIFQEDCLENDPDGSKECQESLLAKHLLSVHASHCEECKFINSSDNDSNEDRLNGNKGNENETTEPNGYGPVGCGHLYHKTEFQKKYTKRAFFKHQRNGKPIPAPISVPQSSHSQTNHNSSFDNGSRESTPKSATNSQHMASFDSGDPMPNDCQRMITTPPPAVLHHDWKTDVIFSHQTDCNNKWAAGLTIFMALVLFFGTIAFMIIFFATRGKTTDNTALLMYESVGVSVVLKLNLTFKEEYGDRNSDEYLSLQQDMSTMLDAMFYRSTLNDVYQRSVIDGLRPGSLYVDAFIYLSTLPKTKGDQTFTEDVLKEYTRKTVYEIIYFGSEENTILKRLHANLQGLFILDVALDVDQPDPVKVPVTEVLNRAHCGTRRRSSTRFRIIGGHPSPIGNWPWIGSMDYAMFGHKCAASLIAPQWAITAAHCLTNVRDAILKNITFGDTSLKTPSPYHQEVAIERIYSHPGFNPVLGDHDIAVLKLQQPVTIYPGRVSPICLETTDAVESQYHQCYIAGWGVTDATSRNVSTELREAWLPLVSQETCSDQYRRERLPNTYVITKNMICAGPSDGSVDACQSDSGGPLVCQQSSGQWNLVGITSFGIGCGNPDFSGVYVRVSKYWEFITSVINGEPSVQCEQITIDECSNILPYTHTYRTSQEDIRYKITQLFGNFSDHSLRFGNISLSDYRLFICLVSLPWCQNNVNQGTEITASPKLVPCQQFCIDVRNFVENTNLTKSYIFDIVCSDMPVASDSSSKLCESNERNMACGPNTHLSISKSQSMNLKAPFTNNTAAALGHLFDCVWFIASPPNTFILIKFHQLMLPECCDVLSIGEGTDIHNRTSVHHRIQGGYEMKPIIVQNQNVWILIQSYEHKEGQYIFDIEVHAIYPETGTIDICQSDLFYNSEIINYPHWWQCDGISDCGNDEDEKTCEWNNVTAKVYYHNSTDIL